MKLPAMRDWIREHRSVAGFGAVLLLVVLQLVVTRYRAMWRLADYKRQLIAQGEKLTLAEVVPPLPKGSYGGPGVVRAVALIPSTFLEPWAMRLIESGVARVAWQQSELVEDVSSDRVMTSTNFWPLLEEQMRDAAGSFDELRDAAKNSEIVFDLNYSQSFSLPLPHLAKLKRAARHLSTSAIYEFHQHDPSAALEDICLGLSLAEHFHEPIMVSQRVRRSIAAIHFDATWEALQWKRWTDAQLEQLQSAWQRLEFMQDAAASLTMERAMDLTEIEHMRTSYDHIQAITSQTGSGALGLDEFMEFSRGVVENPIAGFKAIGSRYPGYWCWCWSWTYDDERAVINYWQQFHEKVQLAEKSPSSWKEIDRSESRAWTFEGMKMEEANGSHYMLTKLVASEAGGRFLQDEANIETQRDMAIAAIALERFHLREKRYPDRLEQLVPRYVKALPRDFFDGQPVRYALRTDGSFLLYSIGPDGVDNHGDPMQAEKTPRPNWRKGRDWVWPRAATAAEAGSFKAKEIANAKKVEQSSKYAPSSQTVAPNK